MTFWQLFQLISWHHIKRYKVRTFFVLIVIAFGTFFLFGSALMVPQSSQVKAAGASALAGIATIEVRSDSDVITPELVQQIQQVEHVEIAAPSSLTLGMVLGTTNMLALWGIDPAPELEIRDYSLVAGTFLQSEGGILITESYADHTGLAPGDTLRLVGTGGVRSYSIVGIVARAGLMAVNGGDIAIMHIADLQALRGDSAIDSVWLFVAPENRENVQAALREFLPDGVQIVSAITSGEKTTVELIADGLQLITNTLPAGLGALLITTTISASMAQRRREIAILRTLGVTRSGIQRLFLFEAAILGAIGVLLGLLLAILTLPQTYSATVNGLTVQTSTSTPGWIYLWAAGGGLLISMGATWRPARRTIQIDPTEALRDPAPDIQSAQFSKWRAIIGMVVMALALVCRLLLDNTPLVSLAVLTGIVFSIAGAIILFPPLMVWMSQRSVDFLQRIFKFSGLLAAENMVRRSQRAIATGLIVFVVVWFWMLSSPFTEGMYNFSRTYVENEYNWDLIISGAGQSATQTIASIPDDAVQTIVNRPDVEIAVRERQREIALNGRTYLIRAVDMNAYADAGGDFYWEQGSAELLPRLADASRPALVASGLDALADGLRVVGHRVLLPTASGDIEFEVVGSYSNLTNSPNYNSVLLIDYALYSQLWDDNAVDRLSMQLVEGADLAEERRILQRQYMADGLYVSDRVEMEALLVRYDGTMEAGIGVLMLPFMLLGIANMQFIAILDRQREFGLLRAVGTLGQQITASVILESLIVTGIAMLFAVPLMYYCLWTMMVDRITGVPILLGSFAIVRILLFIVGAAVLSTYFPARRAGKVDVLEALRYE
jgi:putative ABC transport system permease protein